MFCQECGTKFEGRFCPNCGAPAANTAVRMEAGGTQTGGFPGAGQAPVVPPAPNNSLPNNGQPSNSQPSNGQPNNSPKKKKKKGKLIPVIIVVVLLVSCGALFGKGSGSGGGTGKTQTMQTEKENEQEPERSEPEDGTADAVAETERSGAESEEPKEQPSEQPAAPSKVADYEVKQEYFYDYVSVLGSHDASAFVEIENTGTVPLYLHDGKFDIEDNNGHLLKSESFVSTCPDAIFPGETGYFYENYIDLDDVDTSNGLQFAPHYRVEEAKHEIVDYDASDIDIREDNMWTCMVTGRLTNAEKEEINLIYINVVFYDADGNTIGISGTNITDIQPGETESFEITGQFFRDDIRFSDIAQYRVFPRAWYMQF